jgi:HK97 family phage prohead protease
MQSLECKFHQPEAGLMVTDGTRIEGYASLFGRRDQGGDVVQKGAYSTSLQRLAASGRQVKMLWQHDPTQPIGVWDEVREDAVGLWVKGHLLPEVEKGREAAALLAAGAIDGLSIGYRTVKSERDGKGQRLLSELELWEVSLVTFPMQTEARVSAKGDDLGPADWRDMVQLFDEAREALNQRF